MTGSRSEAMPSITTMIYISGGRKTNLLADLLHLTIITFQQGWCDRKSRKPWQSEVTKHPSVYFCRVPLQLNGVRN